MSKIKYLLGEPEKYMQVHEEIKTAFQPVARFYYGEDPFYDHGPDTKLYTFKLELEQRMMLTEMDLESRKDHFVKMAYYNFVKKIYGELLSDLMDIYDELERCGVRYTHPNIENVMKKFGNILCIMKSGRYETDDDGNKRCVDLGM